MELYNKLRSVPEKYTKTIKAGRLKGMTDIKPQWRNQVMTEVFGPCGFGWYPQNVHFEYVEKGEEIVCNCRLELVVKVDGETSAPIPATGGSKISTVESRGTYVSDEAEKMAYTDALSVAMKMLGVAADIYMGMSPTKYSESPKEVDKTVDKNAPKKKLTAKIKAAMKEYVSKGEVEAVAKQLETYEYTDADKAEILGLNKLNY